MKDFAARWPRLSGWFKTLTLQDLFFSLAERTRAGLRQILRPLIPVTEWEWRERPKKKRRFLPWFERLEKREVPTTTAFLSSAESTGEGSGAKQLFVYLSGSSSQTITVDYATADGTAVAGSDYTSTSGTLTFAPGETSKSFTVSVTDDSLDEDDETFTANLSNPTNATLGSPSTETITILDNDASP